MDYQLLGTLKQANLRNTQSRQKVYQTLKASSSTTMAELLARVGSSLDQATVYRTIATFRQLGLIHDIVINGQRKIELANTLQPHHHHAICSSCGQTLPISDVHFERQVESLAAKYGWLHQSHAFEITGLCRACQRKK